MNKPLFIKITVVFVIALIIFTTLYGVIGSSANTTLDANQIVNNNDVSEAKKFQNEVAVATKDIEKIIETNSELSVPTEFENLEKDMPHVERMIAEVENETGEKFASVFDEEITLDPVKDKEFYQLDKKFEELDTNIIDVVDQL